MTRDYSSYEVVKRDWGRLNEQYVRRGEVAADLSWIRSWDEELNEMNSNKKGRPYRFPRSLVRFVRLLRDVWHLALRQAEGLLRALSEALAFEVPDYTTLWHRLVRDEVEAASMPRRDGVVLAIDSTGLAVTQRGEWLRHHWHVCRGFVRAHVAVDVATSTVAAVIVTDDRVGEARLLPELVRQAAARLDGRIVRVLADRAYDTIANFDFLMEHNIEEGIRIKSRATTHRHGGSGGRPKAVRELRRLGEDGWISKYEYGLRWKAEVVFSAVKRVMGEALRSRRSDLMLREAQHKFVQYNRLAMA